jgi:hypothetical protein
MTEKAAPQDLTEPKDVETRAFERDQAALEDLFALGSTKSPVFTIYKDEKTGNQITVQYRTLVPSEIRSISEMTDRFGSAVGKLITEQLETLARSIVCINGMPLVLPKPDIEAYKKKNGEPPDSLEMARIILIEKIQSEYIIDALWDGYQEFVQEIQKHFEDVKKKLKTQASSS